MSNIQDNTRLNVQSLNGGKTYVDGIKIDEGARATVIAKNKGKADASHAKIEVGGSLTVLANADEATVQEAMRRAEKAMDRVRKKQEEKT